MNCGKHYRSFSTTLAKIGISCVVALMAMPSVMLADDDAAAAIEHARALSRVFRRAASDTSAAVVTIFSVSTPDIDAQGRVDPDDLPFELPPGFELPEGFRFRLPEGISGLKSRSVGSGVIIDQAGIILTNSHVVSGANTDDVLVRLSDGREFEVQDIKTDPMSDLAIVRIDGDVELHAAELGDSDRLEIGDWVIAIGSPFELETTVSAGIISGKGRSVRQIRRGKLLQTDAAINPGNSGGPLVNLDGQVVGINTAIASNSGGYQGIGFAIPSNRAKEVARQLIENGVVRRGYLGIHIHDVDRKVAERLNVPAGRGVAIMRVVPDTPAAEAGLQVDDVITAVGTTRVNDSRDLQAAVEFEELDSSLMVGILRGGTPQTVDVVLRAMPAER